MSNINPFLHSHMTETGNRNMSGINLSQPQLQRGSNKSSQMLKPFAGGNAYDDSQQPFGSNNMDQRFENQPFGSSNMDQRYNNVSSFSNIYASMSPGLGGNMDNMSNMGGNMGQYNNPVLERSNFGSASSQISRPNDDIIRSMAQKIQQTSRSTSEFFQQYDGYQSRQFQAWELAVMFKDCMTAGEANSVAQQLGGNNDQRMMRGADNEPSVDYSKLVNILQRFMPQMPPGNIAYQSEYATKFKTPQLLNYLNQINNSLLQRGIEPKNGFDQFFNYNPHISYNDFTDFLQKINLNVPFNDLQQLFQFFIIGSDQSINKICFVQALKSAGGNHNSPSKFQATMGLQSSNFNQGSPLEVFLEAVGKVMQQYNLSFEGLLAKFSIPNQPYIHADKVEELCLKVGLTLQVQDRQQIIKELDEDRKNLLKTNALRLRLERQNMRSPQTFSPGHNMQQNMHQDYSTGSFRNQQFSPSNNAFSATNVNNVNPFDNRQSMSNLSIGGQQSSFRGSAGFGQQNQNDNRFQGPNLEDILGKIRTTLKSLNIHSIINNFNYSIYEGKQVVVMDQFVQFLMMGDMNLAQHEVTSLVRKYIVRHRYGADRDDYADIEQFEKDVFNAPQQLQLFSEQRSSRMTLQDLFEQLKRYLLSTGGNVMRLFQEIDINKDNMISKAELKIALEKICQKIIPDSDINQVFSLFDQNQDSRMSYSEFCMHFKDFSSNQAISDPSHWAYRIFEAIRNIINVTQKPLSALFGLNSLSFDQPGVKQFISKDQFFKGLSNLGLFITQNEEQRLLQLLDANQPNSWQIDFMNFSEMVGIGFDPSTHLRFVQDDIQFAQQPKVYQQNKKLLKDLLQVFEDNNILLTLLSRLFQQQDTRRDGYVDLDIFLDKITKIDTRRSINMQNLREFAQKFCRQIGNQTMISYREFVDRMNFEQDKYKTIDQIFNCFKSAMTHYQVSTLYELLAKFDTTLGNKTFDSHLLDETLQRLGIRLPDSKLDLLITEYSNDINRRELDFGEFNKDFQEFQLGNQFYQKSQKNRLGRLERNKTWAIEPESAMPGFNHDNIGQRGRVVSPPIGIHQGSQNMNHTVITILEHAALVLQSKPQLRFTDLLLEHDITRTGILSRSDFTNILRNRLDLTSDQVYFLESFYDPQNRNQINIQQFLNDLAGNVTDNNLRIQIIQVAQELDQYGSGSQSIGLDQATTLERYSKDFEEMHKAIALRNSNTYKWFEGFSNDKQTLTFVQFQQAIHSLQLAYFKDQDVQIIFKQLDPKHRGKVDIYAVDDTLRRFTKGSGPDIQDGLLEKIVRAFNGDDAYVLTELSNSDRAGRGRLNTVQFIDFLMRNAPSYQKFSQNDVAFLAKTYVDQFSPHEVDYNKFHSDFTRVRKIHNIATGIYYGADSSNNKLHGLGGPGHIGPAQKNPLMPNFSKSNTKADLHRVQKPPRFQINLAAEITDALIKATYVEDMLAEDFFLQFASKGSEELTYAEWERAVSSKLQLGWDGRKIQNVFEEIDRAFNQNQRRQRITAESIDQAISFSSTRSIEDLHFEILSEIGRLVAQKGQSMRNEIQSYDTRHSRVISVAQMEEIIRGRMKLPINHIDIKFLCKRYIEHLPGQVHYDKLLDDMDTFSQGKFSNSNELTTICDFIRKACYNLNQNVVTHFKKHIRMQGLLNEQDFERAVQELELIPAIASTLQISTLFKEIDQANQHRVSLDQISFFIDQQSHKTTDIFQEEILEKIYEIGNKKSLQIDNVFRQEEVQGKLSAVSFQTVLKRLFDIKQIDSQLLARRYKEANDNINHKRFIQDYKNKGTQEKRSDQNRDTFQDINAQTGISEKIREILKTVNKEILSRRLQISQKFATYDRDRERGLISKTQFIECVDFYSLLQSQNDKTILAEYYSEKSKINQQTTLVSYLRFLDDLKRYGSDQSIQKVNLTGGQKQLYKDSATFIQKKAKQADFITEIKERDSLNKGYLKQSDIESAFRSVGLQLGPKQFKDIIEVLDKNQFGEVSYQQMIEMLFGQEEARKILQQTTGQKSGRLNQGVFVMPRQPVNPLNMILGNIGARVIQSNINIEELLKKKIMTVQSQQFNPKAQEQDLIGILQECKVFLSQEERIELSAFMQNQRDSNNYVSVCEFLAAIGLPPQTLGPKSTKSLPKRILTQQDSAEAQAIIKNLRVELNRQNRVPQQVFESTKQSQQDLSLLPINFRMKLAAEFGQVGKSISDQQIDLLTYYLTQEVPGQISYKKLYLAFTLSEKEPPLRQEGADEIKRYETIIKDQLKKSAVPLEVIDLLHFMKKNSLTITTIFKSVSASTHHISRKDFELSLQEIGFKAKDINKLVEVLDDKGTRTQISIDRLNDYMRKSHSQGKSVTAAVARDRYAGFDPRVRQHLQKISDYMKRNTITLKQIHDQMDINRDGQVDKLEFVNGLQYLQIPGIQASDYGSIFEAIDINNDGLLSINEFGLFIEGAKATRNQMLQQLDPKIIDEMKREINELFKQFDDNGDGVVTADEVFKSMLSLGQRITIQDAKDMIGTVDKNGKGSATLDEFIQLMLPKMKEDLVNTEESMEDLRAMFLEADVDHSGTLSVDEIYSVILKMGTEISLDELVELMNEIDVNRNGELDIDEFIALMSMGDEIQFRSAAAKSTFHQIKKARRLNPLDFQKCFKNMPMNFVPSFIGEKWTKYKKALPCSVFKPQIDPKTMLYKDLLPVFSENLAPNQQAKDFQPRLRPITTQLGCSMQFEQAEGVPLPKAGAGFDRSQIVKRAIRVGLFDTTKKEFIYNAIQVNVVYNEVDEDIWRFSSPKDNSLNPVLFRAADKDLVCKADVHIIFELVIYVKFGETIREMCCGWCQLSPSSLDRQMKHKLPIKGGSPTAEVIIRDEDIHTKRSGFSQIKKFIQTKIDSQLVVEVEPLTKFTDDVKFHLDLLPSICFVQKKLLYFVSGFRNYCGDKLLRESQMGTFKQPHGDVVISTFPKIFDNPDMCEKLVQIWSEDVMAGVTGKNKQNIQFIMMKTKDFIQRLYPVIYSEAYQYSEAYPTNSACGDQYLLRSRENLIIAALRYGQAQYKAKVTQPLEALTMFRPFSVREMDFEVWETSQSKQDRFLRQYEDLGLIGSGSITNTPLNGQSNYNAGRQGSSLQTTDDRAFAQQSHGIGGGRGDAGGQLTQNQTASRGGNKLGLKNVMATAFD